MEISEHDSQRDIYFTRKEFEELETFHPKTNAPNNEGIFKLFNIDGTTKLIKIFHYTRRINTIKTTMNILITYKGIIKEIHKELVLPEDYVYVENIHEEKIGSTFPLIQGKNLQDILSDESYNYKKKMILLKKLGQFLENLNTLIPYFPYKLHIGDLHEGNIMITKRNNIKIIDTISMYIDKNKLPTIEAQPSKYLEFNETIKEEKYQSKYPKQSNGLIIPNKDTDIFCYLFIILNTLANTDLAHIPLKDLLNYLDYLEYLKYNKYFLFSITKLFSLEENVNPYEFLNSITHKQYTKANYLSYKRKTGIDLTNISS